MRNGEVVHEAVAALGEGQRDDYVLAPTRHAGELEPRAPALAALLRGAKTKTLAGQYERFDREAQEAQSAFKHATNHANGAVLGAAVLSALIMAAGLLTTGDTRSILLAILGAAALLTGGYATFWLFRAREGRLLEAWMTNRARAETTRLEYFGTVTASGDDEAPSPGLDLLRLEYFRRYQLDVQIAYYGARCRDHRHSADRTLTLGGIAVAAASLASGAAGLAGMVEPGFAALAALGILGTALGAFASTREAMNQDRRNAERYARTLDVLERLRARLDDVRAAVLAGNRAALRNFVEAVHEELSLEHRQWLEVAEGAHAAIDRLERTLKEVEAPRGAPGPG